MAIYINGKQLEPKKDGSSMEKKYYEDMQELKGLFNKFRKGTEPSVLIFKRDFAKKWNNKGTTFKPAPPIAIPLRTSYYDRDGAGAIDIRYSASPPENINGKLRWAKSMETIYEMYTVNENQSDLAWFLFKASRFFDKGVLKLVDTGVEIEAKWDKMTVQADVVKALFSETIDEDQLAKIYHYFIDGKYVYSESQTIKENAMRLWDIALSDSINGKNQLMKPLKDAIDKALKISAPVVEGWVNVEGIDYPVLPMPEGWQKKHILSEAESYGINDLPIRPLKNEVLYSILQAKIKQLNPV